MNYIEACERGSWHFQIWERGKKASTLRTVPYRCRSWRHDGECRMWCGACDFMRVKAALESRSYWCYLVLTYPANINADNVSLFRWGVKHWTKLRRKIVERYRAIEYIQTWEVHKSGKPHVNVMISNPYLYKDVIESHTSVKKRWLEPLLVECGWGPVSWLSPKDNKEQMAGYLTKLANELTGVGPKMQVPVNAPRHFRRIRASKGFLPPRVKDKKLTGKLVKQPVPIAGCQTSCKIVIEEAENENPPRQLQFHNLRGG